MANMQRALQISPEGKRCAGALGFAGLVGRAGGKLRSEGKGRAAPMSGLGRLRDMAGLGWEERNGNE